MFKRLPSTLKWAGVFLFLLPCVSSASEGRNIIKWAETFLGSVRQDSSPPAQVSRRLAILFLAARDAHALGEKSFYDNSPVPDSKVDPETAAVGALVFGAEIFYPSHRANYRLFLKTYRTAAGQRALSKGMIDASLDYGRKVVFAYFNQRANDGSSSQLTFIPKIEPGQWRRTPPDFRPPELPHWGKVKPFLLERADQFRAPAPPSLDSAEFKKAVEEVRRLGGKKADGEDKKIAEFWSCFSYTSTPSGHWNVILGDLISMKEEFSVSETLEAFAILNVTLADTAIACWETKFHYRYWRPEDAIRHLRKADWNSHLVSPPHPEYVSGHSSFAGAGAYVLQKVFGSDKVKIEATSDSLPDVVRKYESFSTCASEMGRSRILGGIHYSFSDKEGQKLGRSVAEFCWGKFKE